MLREDISTPSKEILPEVGDINPAISLAVVVLPEPLSPAKPKVSLGLTEKETPSVALTWAISFLKITVKQLMVT